MQPEPINDLASPAAVDVVQTDRDEAVEVNPFEILTPGKSGTGFKDFSPVVTSAEVEDEVVDPKGSSVLALVDFSDTVPELDSDLAGSSAQIG